MRSRFFRTLPLFVATAALAAAGPELLPAVLIAIGLVAALVIGPRLPLDKPTQRLASMVVLILVIAGVRAAGISARSDNKLGAFAFGCAVAPLAIATLRLHVVEPDWGHVVTWMFGFVGIMACGAVKLGPVYGVLVASYLAAVIVAMRADDRSRASSRQVPRRAAAVGALIVALACAFTVGAALVLRPIQAYAQQRINRSFEDYMLSRAAFSDSMHLGRLTRLLQSNRVVLRLRGPRVERLRGAVLDHYDGRRWLREAGGAPTPIAVERGPLLGPGVVEIRSVGDDGDHLFLPYELAAVATPNGLLRADGHGIARTTAEGAEMAWLRVGSRAVLPVADAGKADLGLLTEIIGPLHALATRWTEDTHTPEDALNAIQRHLKAEYTYSLASERKSKLDPIVDFLFQSRVGHCEYFASSMALLARTIGIPTRLVTGYRVGEHNPYLGHYVVRERNAHAWVEAWLPGRGWVTYDPTPMAELPQDELFEQSGVPALTELFAAGVGRVEDWLAERTVGELSVAAIVGLVIFAIVRALGARRVSVDHEMSKALAFSPPLAGWLTLEARLAKRGVARREDEPLERFAERVPERFKALVLRYACVRYGQVDDAEIDADLRAALEGE